MGTARTEFRDRVNIQFLRGRKPFNFMRLSCIFLSLSLSLGNSRFSFFIQIPYGVVYGEIKRKKNPLIGRQ